MWDIGPLCNCILVKRSEDEGEFIRVARRRDPEAHRYPCGGTRGHEQAGCSCKAITGNDIVCGCSVMFFWMLCYVFMNVVNVLINNQTITS